MCGEFSLDKAYTLESLEEMTLEQRLSLLYPTEDVFASYPICKLDGFMLKLCRDGAEIYQSKIKTSFPDGSYVRLYDSDGFFALGKVSEFEQGGAIKPVKVFRLK